jgi:hypothetical protein
MSNPYTADASGSETALTGIADTGTGVIGNSKTSHGVHGTNGQESGGKPAFGSGVWGDSANGYGVFGSSKTAEGVYGVTTGKHSGVRGINGTPSGAAPAAGCGVWGDSETGYGVYGTSKAGTAGYFAGNLTVTGSITASDVQFSGMDCAEDFDTADEQELEPGTVVIFQDGEAIKPSDSPYNKRVAGVVSGAGAYRPGIILGRSGPRLVGKAPVALFGRVYCKVDATDAPITAGDLLTTSLFLGHAMKAQDQTRAFGAIIGKALEPLESGRGLIPILVSLQ